jgi:hypothetical protein
MALAQTHLDAAKATTPGARAAVFIRGFASHIQAALNDPDNLAQVRELCVEAAQMADDVALTVEHGEEAVRMRETAAQVAARPEAQTPVAPSVDTPRVPPTAHAAPTDYQRAPTPETVGTVPAQPTRGERGQSAPAGDGPGPGTAKPKEDKGEPAGARTATPKR